MASALLPKVEKARQAVEELLYEVVTLEVGCVGNQTVLLLLPPLMFVERLCVLVPLLVVQLRVRSCMLGALWSAHMALGFPAARPAH